MIKIYVKKQSNYPVDTPKLKRSLRKFLKKEGIVSDAQVNVAIVGKSKMKKLARKYLNEKNEIHNVLSFVESEVQDDFAYPPEGVIRLGDIVICYPKIFDEAKAEGKMIDEKVEELVTHGAEHLLGKHHQ